VVVTEKSAWMISLTLVLVIVALIGALVFFFIQNTKRRGTAAPDIEKKPDIPEAHLEDLDKICGEDNPLKKLDKARINIGRSQRNDIVIQQPAISGFHATIEFRNMAFYLEDQRSTNGTQLNGSRVTPNEPARLKSGDRITFAKYDFKFIMVDQLPFGDTVMLSMTALADPEAEATIVLDLDGADSKQGLISCLQNHLMQIYGLGPKHKAFVNTYFAHDTLDIIAVTAHENLKLTKNDAEQHCTPIMKNKAFYVVCSLPAAIDKAAEWYGTRHNGFTQFIFKWIRSEQYQSAQCDQLCIVTFGQDPATWVSITIVPTNAESNPVEIMSVDFLNEEEKSSLALDFDHHGRVL
jgi:pSer/pThr/pTyr-binding forkhead associated (FHA) protein